MAEAAIRQYWENGDIPGRIICDEKKFPSFIEREIAGIFAESGELIELCQFACGGIDGKRGDGAGLGGFVCSVEKFSVGMDGDPGGIGRGGRDPLRREFSGGRGKFEEVDAFALGFCGVSADVDEVVCGGRRVFGGWSADCGEENRK